VAQIIAQSRSWLGLVNHGSMARIATQWLRGSDLEMVLARDLSSMARWLGSISAHQNIYPTNGFFFFFLNIANKNKMQTKPKIK
jgi:hypothetical protein